MDVVRENAAGLDRLLAEARELGTTAVRIAHAPRPGGKGQVDLVVNWRGNNTRSDQFTLAVLLNYLSARLREDRLYGP